MRPAYPTTATPAANRMPRDLIAVLVMACAWFAWYVGRNRYHYTGRQIEEISLLPGHQCARRRRRSVAAGHSALQAREGMAASASRSLTQKDDRFARDAWKQNAVVLGYDVHGEPWLWPDKVRVMQGIVLGMTGAGKTTLLTQHHHSGPGARWSALPISRIASPW